ncbi:MAG TPA: lipoprotein insertase outer membrane protein LolB [Woeseiaceae bacterium]|nr:lipoprotein insertase outer membrane protein LolB [Woeseiaceae bacterium]
MHSPTNRDQHRSPAGLLLLILLGGCAAERGVSLPPMDDWETRRQVLAAIDEWEFKGRVGVRAGEEGFNGHLRWRQNGDLFRASVSGPLGIGTVRIEGRDGRVRVTDEDGQVTELEDADAGLREMYGWTLPVTSLRYWALGLPDPASPAATELGEGGRLARLEQRDWTVSITDYREDAGQPMPRRMTAVNHDTRVRLVIDNWTFH